MKYKTKGNSSPQGKPRVYFTGYPADVRLYFETITGAILKLHNCAIFYDEDPEHPEDAENFIRDLDRMQLVVLVVTSRYIYGDTFAHNTVFQHAMEHHIPVLPILEEGGIEKEYNAKCGNLQFLDPNARDDTAIPFEEKLKKCLDRVLTKDELAAKVRAAFDAYIFLSYRKKDRRYAQQLMRLIHENPFCRDIAIWYDEFLVPGEDFNDAIRKAVEKSELFALVVTPSILEDDNYIMTTEYPAAQEAGKPILPAILKPTDDGELAARYENIPAPVDPEDGGTLSAALRDALATAVRTDNHDDPRHIFFIGLAYLGGIDVEVNYELALQLITRAAEAGLPEAIEKLAEISWAQGDLNRALNIYEQLVIREKTALETGTVEARRSLASCYEKLGEIRQAQGDLMGARESYGRSCAIYDQIAATGTAQAWRDLSVSYSRLGDVVRDQGDLAGAVAFYEKGLTIRERLAEETDTAQAQRDLTVSYDSLGNVSRARGDLAGAKGFYEKSLAIRERLEAETGTAQARRDLSVSYNNLGDICEVQGDLDGAKTFYKKDLAINERLVAETETIEVRQDLAISYYSMGDISRAQGNLAEARTFYEKSLAIREQLAAKTGTIEAYYELAASYHKMSMAANTEEEQQKYLRKAEEILIRITAQCPDVPMYTEQLALVRKYIR